MHESGCLNYLFHSGQVEGVLVAGPELHEPHVGRLAQFRDGLDAREEPDSY